MKKYDLILLKYDEKVTYDNFTDELYPDFKYEVNDDTITITEEIMNRMEFKDKKDFILMLNEDKVEYKIENDDIICNFTSLSINLNDNKFVKELIIVQNDFMNFIKYKENLVKNIINKTNKITLKIDETDKRIFKFINDRNNELKCFIKIYEKLAKKTNIKIKNKSYNDQTKEEAQNLILILQDFLDMCEKEYKSVEKLINNLKTIINKNDTIHKKVVLKIMGTSNIIYIIKDRITVYTESNKKINNNFIKCTRDNIKYLNFILTN